LEKQHILTRKSRAARRPTNAGRRRRRRSCNTIGAAWRRRWLQPFSLDNDV